jgi:hypothetical protein
MTGTPGLRATLARSLATAALVIVAAACRSGAEARNVADRFMALYYDDAHVADAAELCTGQAKDRLNAELQFMAGAPPSQELPATFQLHAGKVPSRNEAMYVYRVHLARPDAGPLFARLVLVRDGGRWLVTQFDEKERVPHRRTA